MDIRDIVKGQMDARGWSVYRLKQEIGDAVPSSTLYGWLGGTTQSISTQHLSAIFAALEIKVVVRALKRKGR